VDLLPDSLAGMTRVSFTTSKERGRKKRAMSPKRA
jgi:hypothetical protein